MPYCEEHEIKFATYGHCPECAKLGRYNWDICPHCKGSGRKWATETNNTEYKVVCNWNIINDPDHTMFTSDNQQETHDYYSQAIECLPNHYFKIVRVTYETIASYEPGMEDANDDQG